MVNKVICEVCGKEVDSRGLRMHMETHKVEQVEQKIEEKTGEDMTPEETTVEKVKEVELKPEKDVVEKKETKTVELNSCGECGQTFKGNPNFCPKCGCEFE